MSQHDFEIANQGFPSFRSDLNSGLQALASNSAGATEPSTTYAYQFWYDSTANLLKMRNTDDDAWITLAYFDQTNDEWEVRSAVIQAVDSAGVTIKNDGGTTLIEAKDDGSVVFRTDDVTIETSGNFLVGTTSSINVGSGSDVGVMATNNGGLVAYRNGDTSAFFGRQSTDGDIVQFRKDGTTVGSIGTVSTALYVASPSGSDSGLRFDGAAINPCTTAGAYRDNAIDLGSTSAGFKDLYLDGGVYLGGTAATNKLDDYEEGTWTPTGFASGYTASTATGTYTKIGNMVYVNCSFVFSAVPASNSSCSFSGLPFNATAFTAGNFRDNTTTGAIYVFRIAGGGDSAEINSMDNVTAGSNRTIRTSETYTGFAVYQTTS